MTPQNTQHQTAAAEPRETSLLDRIAEHQAEIGARYMPTLTPRQFTERERLIAELREMLVEGVDYGVIPGTDKPTLLLPGAQKVCAYFGYVPSYVGDQIIEDWTGAVMGEPLFFYRFTCNLEKDGKRVGSGLGSCNNLEVKYRYRWVSEDVARLRPDFATLQKRVSAVSEFAFAIDKAETGGQYGKPAAYWQRWREAIESGEARKVTRKTKQGREMDAYEMGGSTYRVPNDQFPDVLNTVLKMGKKRAYIDATLSATGLSQYFTQDVEDFHQQNDTAEQTALAQKRIAEESAKAAAQQQQTSSVPAELQLYLDGLKAKGGFPKACAFVKGQMEAADPDNGGPLFDIQAAAWRQQNPEVTVPAAHRFLLTAWGEVERLRAEASGRERQRDSTAMGVA